MEDQGAEKQDDLHAADGLTVGILRGDGDVSLPLVRLREAEEVQLYARLPLVRGGDGQGGGL